MEIAIDRSYANLAQLTGTGPASRWVGFLMDGTPPANAAELKARVDMNDMHDIHNKSIGNFVCNEAQYMTLRESGTTILSMWPLAGQPTHLKGGSKTYTSYPTYQVYLPDRIFRVDGKPADFAHGSPAFMSGFLVSSSNYPTISDNYEAFKLRDTAADPVTVEYQLEYDTDRTVTAVRYGGVGLSETTSTTGFALQYFNEATQAWVTASTTAITAANNLGGVNAVLATPVTAKKFRMQITSAATPMWRRYRGCALLGTEVLTPTPPSPTWFIMVPIHWWYYGNVSNVGFQNMKPNVAEYKYMPAIIDTIGAVGSGAKAVIDPANGYSFVSYSMALGNIK